MQSAYRYTIARDGRLLDSSPMEDGGNILVFDNGQWVTWHGTVGQWKDSIPVTPEEAARFCQDGTIPAEARRMIAEKSYAPDPEEDDE